MKRRLKLLLLSSVALGTVEVATRSAMLPPPDTLAVRDETVRRVEFLDRNGLELSRTYENRWNYQQQVELHEIPPFLVNAFLAAEDNRFFEHRGTDWRALARSVWLNVSTLRSVSGGSTISEQSVRLIHPRKRSLWSRWLELREARVLEKRFSKAEILEFYLNQVPYARKRRGIVAAARTLFDRDLSTLSKKEMLTLALLVRAPSKLDPVRLAESGNWEPLERRISLLAGRLEASGALQERDEVSSPLQLRPTELQVNAADFLAYVQRESVTLRAPNGRVRTTLDATVQKKAQALLAERIRLLRNRSVRDGAVLVVENSSRQILAWASAHSGKGEAIDAVISPRQPGSTLKPFLYALALEKGWTCSTILDDSPLARGVGAGLKQFRNYSNTFYGPVRLRESLGSSLNIPAIQTVAFVGPDVLLRYLRRLGFTSLTQPAHFYGEGLALGNGEVSLLELVRAYTVFANRGVSAPLQFLLDSNELRTRHEQIVPEEVTSLVANILSDPKARQLEFGSGNLLHLPVQTAVKTGTSTDYHDAWAVGFSSRFTVGVWMGNLDRTPMRDVTGSTGPALVLRAVFNELERRGDSSGLYVSNKLISRAVCRETGKVASPECPQMRELFLPESVPTEQCHKHAHAAEAIDATEQTAQPSTELHLELPSPGLRLARDPRIPDHLEAFPFTLPRSVSPVRTEWVVDGQIVGETAAGERRFLWRLVGGRHEVKARIYQGKGQDFTETPPVGFYVQ